MALPPARVLKTLFTNGSWRFILGGGRTFLWVLSSPRTQSRGNGSPRIAEALQSLGGSSHLPKGIPPGCHISGPVFAHPSVKWPAFCAVEGPVFFG